MSVFIGVHNWPWSPLELVIHVEVQEYSTDQTIFSLRKFLF